MVDNALPVNYLPTYEPKPRNNGPLVVGTLRLLEPAKGICWMRSPSLSSVVDAPRQNWVFWKSGAVAQGTDTATSNRRSCSVLRLDREQGAILRQPKYLSACIPHRGMECKGASKQTRHDLPAIGTMCLCPRRIIKHNVTGLLVPVGARPRSMADAIETLSAISELRQAHAQCE